MSGSSANASARTAATRRASSAAAWRTSGGGDCWTSTASSQSRTLLQVRCEKLIVRLARAGQLVADVPLETERLEVLQEALDSRQVAGAELGRIGRQSAGAFQILEAGEAVEG